MADQRQVTPPDPEVIRHQMEETRESLAEKLEVLEKKVTDTVQEATSAVSETVQEAKEAVSETVEVVKDTVESTVETVKETVSSTLDTIRDTLDLRGQVEQHPWPMVGGAMALGFVGGWLMGPARKASWQPEPAWQPEEAAAEAPASPNWGSNMRWEPASQRQPEARQPSWWDHLLSAFGSEIDKLKGLALGTLGGVVRDLVAEAVPENLKPTVVEIVNDLTTKLGGKPIEGRVLPETQCQQEGGQETRASFSS